MIYTEYALFQLSEEEKEKIRRRRERNKIAAQKCRKKKKMGSDHMVKVGNSISEHHCGPQVKAMEPINMSLF